MIQQSKAYLSVNKSIPQKIHLYVRWDSQLYQWQLIDASRYLLKIRPLMRFCFFIDLSSTILMGRCRLVERNAYR